MSHKAKQRVEASREQSHIISFAFHLSQLNLSFSLPGLWLRADPLQALLYCVPGSASSTKGRIVWLSTLNTDKFSKRDQKNLKRTISWLWIREHQCAIPSRSSAILLILQFFLASSGIRDLEPFSRSVQQCAGPGPQCMNLSAFFHSCRYINIIRT